MVDEYRQVYDMKRVNELQAEGYTHKETIVETYSDDATGRIVSKVSYMMTLKDPGYGDVVEVRDAPQDEANQLLALNDGWVIASTSVSSKFYRMVKRGEDPLRNALKAWIASDGELDSVISIVEDYC